MRHSISCTPSRAIRFSRYAVHINDGNHVLSPLEGERQRGGNAAHAPKNEHRRGSAVMSAIANPRKSGRGRGGHHQGAPQRPKPPRSSSRTRTNYSSRTPSLTHRTAGPGRGRRPTRPVDPHLSPPASSHLCARTAAPRASRRPSPFVEDPRSALRKRLLVP